MLYFYQTGAKKVRGECWKPRKTVDMAGLELNLFGKPEVIHNGKAVTAYESTKVQALLYYLAVTGRAHSREMLATLLWGDLPESTAKRNLTKALTNLRQLIEPFLSVDRHTVALNSASPVVLDVAIFQAAIESSVQLDPKNPVRDLAPLRTAVNLYHGEFLEGFYVKNALEFEEWALGQREYFRQLMVQGLQRLTEQSARLENDPAVTLEHAQRWLALEPWQEAAHRQMMLLLIRSGQRDTALAQYETCRRILAEEFGVEPMPETQTLYDRIRSFGAAIPNNLPPEPGAFVGRAAELDQITQYLNSPAHRMITLVGPGGIGKTRIALQAAQRFAAPDRVFEDAEFRDGVYFIDLAPVYIGPVSEAALPERVAGVVATAIAEALRFTFRNSAPPFEEVVAQLADKQLLLVIDNFEECMAGAQHLAGLVRRAAQVNLLITSRERLNLREEWALEVDGLPFPDEVDQKTP